MSLIDEFRKLSGAILSDYPELKHSVEDQGNSYAVTFQRASESGFDVKIEVFDKSISIETDRGWHTDIRDASTPDLQSSFGMVRDLLSSNMRIRELWAGNGAYKWYVEGFDGKNWVGEEMMGLFFWNFFGRRTERIFKNDLLPPRPLN